MTELKGFEEEKGASRAKGVQHGAFPNRQTWLERKTQEAAELGVTKQPYCLIIGGGHSRDTRDNGNTPVIDGETFRSGNQSAHPLIHRG